MSKKKTQEEVIEGLMAKPTEVVKKKRVYKKRDPADIVKPKWSLLKESIGKSNEQLFRVYKEDPLKARVLHNNNKSSFYEKRTLYFDYGINHFEICRFEKEFGISKTNRIYSRVKKTMAIIFKGGKFWYYFNEGTGKRANKGVFPLTVSRLQEVFYNLYGVNSRHEEEREFYLDKVKDLELYMIFDKRFFWFKSLMEYEFNRGLTLTTVLSKKLFGHDKLNRHIFGVNKDIISKLLSSNILYQKHHYYGRDNFFKWKEIRDNIENIQHFDFKIFDTDEQLVHDTLKMAIRLGRKINGKWGHKKLKDMHDLWSVEIQNILLDCEIERDLKNLKVFEDFAEFSGYRLIRTNKELITEGMRQNHCVGTYIDRVDSGECGIYDVDNYTLQLNVIENEGQVIDEQLSVVSNDYYKFSTAELKGARGKKLRSQYNVSANKNFNGLDFLLHKVQFKGRFNSDAPSELVNSVEKKLYEFSKDYNFEDIYERTTSNSIRSSMINNEIKVMRERGYNVDGLAINIFNEDVGF